MPHKFGNVWTELKLDVIAGYLGFYTDVLKAAPSARDPFKLWYIDAFAGSGTRTVEVASSDLILGEQSRIEEVEIAGSARRALDVIPPFHRFFFIEGDRTRFSDLAKLQFDFPERDITCLHGDANRELQRLFTSSPWCDQRGNRGQNRAVVFLDPYGMSVEWQTLITLANSESVDVWYLFPTEGINRQLAGDLDRVENYKQIKLDEIFGTRDWRTDLYKPSFQGGLFGTIDTAPLKTVSKADIEVYGEAATRINLPVCVPTYQDHRPAARLNILTILLEQQ